MDPATTIRPTLVIEEVESASSVAPVDRETIGGLRPTRASQQVAAAVALLEVPVSTANKWLKVVSIATGRAVLK